MNNLIIYSLYNKYQKQQWHNTRTHPEKPQFALEKYLNSNQLKASLETAVDR